jgi:MFS transporter, DHA1 family, purine base/nucleoside efflux pump
MDKRVYLLTIVSFVVGMVELIIGGILDLVAKDLGVSIGKAGLLITVFSLVFAIAAPILLTVTARVERKRLTLLALIIFLLGNGLAVLSPSYSLLFMARIISAASGSLLVVLCVTMASNIVTEKYRARAIGIVFMGVSASLVLGVPVGLMLGNAFGWQAPFILITLLTVFSIIGVYFFMEKMEPKPAIPISQQLRTLKNRKILFAQLTSFLFLAGHLTLYGYLTPFLKSALGLNGTWVSVVYLIFGVAAVVGGGIGGMFSDRFGSKQTILAVIVVFAVAIFAIPHTTFALPLFLAVMVIWSMLSWAITPAMQSYLIEASPETSDIQQSLNNSALHFGIAFGSFIGGIVIERFTVELNATVGGLFIILALAAAVFSMWKKGSVGLSLFGR